MSRTLVIHNADAATGHGKLPRTGRLTQLVRVLPLQGRGRGFESLIAHFFTARRRPPFAWVSVGAANCSLGFEREGAR